MDSDQNKNFIIGFKAMEAGKVNKQEIMNKIGEVIARFDDVEVAYIFGSFLQSNDFNDVDVALLISKELNPYERFKFAMKVGRELERRIKPRFEFDVKILNYSPPEFQYEVIKKGRAVFLRNRTKKVEYESELISNYLDLEETYKLLDKEFLSRL